jgi:SPP1 family predicted phage head-tail adaptor
MTLLGQVSTRYHTATLRHRIEVKYRTIPTFDDAGQPTEVFVTRYESEPASFEQVSGGEFLRGRKIDVNTTAIFTVNYRDGYDEKDLILFDGNTYGIVRIDYPEGVKRYIEIQAKR